MGGGGERLLSREKRNAIFWGCSLTVGERGGRGPIERGEGRRGSGLLVTGEEKEELLFGKRGPLTLVF